VVSSGLLSDITTSIQLLAKALGEIPTGEKIVLRFQSDIKKIKAGARTRPKRKIFLELSDNPLMTVGKNTFLNDAATLVGAENIYAENSIHYPKPSWEDVINKNPEVIIFFAMNDNPAKFTRVEKSWVRFPFLSAVKNRKIRTLTSDSLLRPTPRIIEGLKVLEKAIYE